MSQHDYVISNQDGASFRADINDALASIVSCNSGLTAPAATFAYQVWHDTTTGIIKQRNAGNTAWLNLADVLLAGKTVTGDVTVVGNVTYTNQITQAATQATTSGTSKDFTVPSWAKKITVSLQGVSTSGASSVLVQLGNGGTPKTSGYLGASIITGAAGAATALSSGFRIFYNNNDLAAAVRHGSIVLTNMGSNIWAASGNVALSDSVWICVLAGSVTLAGVLDLVRVTTVNGTDTFDAGSVNIIYE